MNNNELGEPTFQQLSSDRAVFQFQSYVDRFFDDLKKSVSNSNTLWGQLNNAVYIPVAPRSPERNQTTYYLAKFCRTYCFTVETMSMLTFILKNSEKEIAAYWTDKNAQVPHGLKTCSKISRLHFEALFATSERIAHKSDWHPSYRSLDDFKNALKNDMSDSKNGLREAHAIFVDTVSEIPYTGMLPEWLDTVAPNVSETNVGFAILFNGATQDAEFNGYIFQLANAPETIQPKALPPLKIPKANGENDKLKELLLQFANPFLNFTDWQGSNDNPYPNPFKSYFSGLAFPLYERTEIMTTSNTINCAGAFLGWVVLHADNSLEETSLGQSWPVIALALNSLADAILTALADEVVSEYANHTLQEEPLAYLRKRMEDLGGFITNKNNGENIVTWTPGHTGHSSTGTTHVEEPVELFPKHNTIMPDDNYKRKILFPRLQRTLRQLQAVYLSAQVDQFRKYKHLMDALTAPLNNISSALTTMQRDTQELRAILYEPTHTIFESYQRISELFEEGCVVRVSKHIHFVVAHQPDRYFGCEFNSPEGSWEKDSPGNDVLSVQAGRLCLITAVCRIFGNDKMLYEARDFKTFVLLAKAALSEADFPIFKNLKEDIEWLFAQKLKRCNCHEKFNFHDIPEFTGDKMIYALEALKDVAFSPFKIGVKKWSSLAIQLALPKSCRDGHLTIERNDTKSDSINFLEEKGYSPINFNKVLEFVRAVVASDMLSTPKETALIEVRVKQNKSVFFILIRFHSKNSVMLKPDKIEALMMLLNCIARNPTAKYMAGFNRGSYFGPFENLVTSLTGISDEKTPGSWQVLEPDKTIGELLKLKYNEVNYYFKLTLTIKNNNEGTLEMQWGQNST